MSAPTGSASWATAHRTSTAPFETADSTADRSDIIQRKQRINEPVQHLLMEHIRSLVEYPPVRKAASFDFSEVIRQLQAEKK